MQAVLIEIYGAEVLAVAAVLPLEHDRSVGLTFEVDLAQKMTYSLREAGFMQPVGKRGRATLYGAAATERTCPSQSKKA